MDIKEALSELSNFIDMLCGMGVLTEGEEKLIGEVEATIINYVNERN